MNIGFVFCVIVNKEDSLCKNLKMHLKNCQNTSKVTFNCSLETKL